MQATRANRVPRRLAAMTGLLLIMAAAAGGADPLDAAAATATASQARPSDAVATEVDSLVSALADESDVSKDSASNGERPVRAVDDAGAFLGQLVTQYFEHYN
jgi:hypothetical protein